MPSYWTAVYKPIRAELFLADMRAPVDPESDVIQERFALVTVKKKSRPRFPASCVDVVATREEALARHNESENIYAAQVIGPSRSSEGVQVYYLVDWIA